MFNVKGPEVTLKTDDSCSNICGTLTIPHSSMTEYRSTFAALQQ